MTDDRWAWWSRTVYLVHLTLVITIYISQALQRQREICPSRCIHLDMAASHRGHLEPNRCDVSTHDLEPVLQLRPDLDPQSCKSNNPATL